jgi:hypothetical protein
LAAFIRNILPSSLGLKKEATDFSEKVINVVNSYENMQRHMAEYGSFFIFILRRMILYFETGCTLTPTL